ncbi:MAG: hypothetical protein ABDH31_02930 [Chlorobiota bacterium]
MPTWEDRVSALLGRNIPNPVEGATIALRYLPRGIGQTELARDRGAGSCSAQSRPSVASTGKRRYGCSR